MDRRTLLSGGLLLGLSAGAGAWTTTKNGLAAFGDAPGSSPELPAKRRPSRILELFLYGGVTTWETFYAVEEHGRKDDPDPALKNTQLYAFYEPGNKSSPLLQALSACGIADDRLTLTPFANDAAGKQVKLGPLLAPLLARKDLLERLRIVVTRHDLEPHEAAIPFALAGRALGSASLACLGAHVQRYFLDREGSARKTPFSYTFSGDDIAADNLRAAVATGIHPGSARPLLINMAGSQRLIELLGRAKLGAAKERAGYDALVKTYVDAYSERLRFAARGAPLRSPRLQELEVATSVTANASSLQDVLAAEFFRPRETAMCDVTQPAANQPAQCLALATHLLTHPKEPARYCLFVDPGLVAADGGGGYDSHGENSNTQSRNLRNTLTELVSHIREPGETDPAKLDLDDTLIIFNMEFGRSPGAQDGGMGRNHWPYGYVTVYLGGPVRSEQRGIYGAIGPDGKATTFTSPSEHRVAALLALGIWPFSPEGFGVSDVPGARTEHEAAEAALSRVLGYG